MGHSFSRWVVCGVWLGVMAFSLLWDAHGIWTQPSFAPSAGDVVALSLEGLGRRPVQSRKASPRTMGARAASFPAPTTIPQSSTPLPVNDGNASLRWDENAFPPSVSAHFRPRLAAPSTATGGRDPLPELSSGPAWDYLRGLPRSGLQRPPTPGTGVEYLLTDSTLTVEQRRAIGQIFQRYEQRDRDYRLLLRGQLRELENQLNDQQATPETAPQVLRAVQESLALERRILRMTLQELRGTLTLGQWERLGAWMETHPGARLYEYPDTSESPK